MYRGKGGLGVLPQKIFGLNGVKSSNSRRENMKMPFHKSKRWEVEFLS